MDSTPWLLVAAMLGNGLLVGASLDQVIKQLPARHRIGVIAFSDYSKAGDLGRGIAWYAALGSARPCSPSSPPSSASPMSPERSRRSLCGWRWR